MIGGDHHYGWQAASIQHGANILGAELRQIGRQHQNGVSVIAARHDGGAFQGKVEVRRAVFLQGASTVVASQGQRFGIAADHQDINDFGELFQQVDCAQEQTLIKFGAIVLGKDGSQAGLAAP